MTNNKDFSHSKYPSREIDSFFHSPLNLVEARIASRQWRFLALMGWGIALMELISFVVLPYFFPGL